jgi:hypothetical protein
MRTADKLLLRVLLALVIASTFAAIVLPKQKCIVRKPAPVDAELLRWHNETTGVTTMIEFHGTRARVLREALSDNSEVFNVDVRDVDGTWFAFAHALDENSAVRAATLIDKSYTTATGTR